MNESKHYHYAQIKTADKQINGETNTSRFKDYFDVVNFSREKRLSDSGSGTNARSSHAYVYSLTLKCTNPQTIGQLKDLCDQQSPMGLVTITKTRMSNGKEVDLSSIVLDTRAITYFDEGDDTVTIVGETTPLDSANKGKDIRFDASGGQAVYPHAIKA